MRSRPQPITPTQRLELVTELLSRAFLELASRGQLSPEDDESRAEEQDPRAKHTTRGATT